jgi:hypothetical protein
VIAFLAAAVARTDGDPRARATRLLERAVCWLLAAERRGGGFAIAVGARAPARLAWCYGDAGVASALAQAAAATGEATWRRAAIRLAHGAAARSFASSGVVDGGLCHGAAGLVHIFDRLHRATGDARCAAAAADWLERLFALRRADGIAGFPAQAGARDDARWIAEPGLLFGAGGVAVTLASLLDDRCDGWERALLSA